MKNTIEQIREEIEDTWRAFGVEYYKGLYDITFYYATSQVNIELEDFLKDVLKYDILPKRSGKNYIGYTFVPTLSADYRDLKDFQIKLLLHYCKPDMNSINWDDVVYDALKTPVGYTLAVDDLAYEVHNRRGGDHPCDLLYNNEIIYYYDKKGLREVIDECGWDAVCKNMDRGVAGKIIPSEVTPGTEVVFLREYLVLASEDLVV